MKIFNTSQIRKCDQLSIQDQGIASVDLMERAADACLQWIKNHFPISSQFVILCGMGNNGGDGLALTRLLLQEKYKAIALVLKHREEFSPDALQNHQRLEKLGSRNITPFGPSDQLNEIPENIVLIDAIFGTGINGPIEGWLADFIQIVNKLPNRKIAIDIPSGLSADELPELDSAVLKVNHTLSFQFYKRSFLHQEGAFFCGNVHKLDIGLSPAFIEDTASVYQMTDELMVKRIFKPRPQFSHKGTFGSAGLIGGSYGMIGSISLATMAALRVGTGKVYVYAPECGYSILQTLCPEAIFEKCGINFIEKISLPQVDILGIGPGLGKASLTKRAFFSILQEAKMPMVLDADALNLLAANKEEYFSQIPEGSVLTPHPGEFERLFGPTGNSMERVGLGLKQAKEHNLIIILKGHYSAILLPDGNCFYNSTGNSGLAKGGSGDVLTGVITGLMAQGYSAKDAALFGVWLHGKAADLASEEKSMEAMTAKDISDFFGSAFTSLYSGK